jgi:hypothetical protein
MKNVPAISVQKMLYVLMESETVSERTMYSDPEL